MGKSEGVENVNIEEMRGSVERQCKEELENNVVFADKTDLIENDEGGREEQMKKRVQNILKGISLTLDAILWCS